MLEDKLQILRLAKQCREVDRQYEFNNNGQLDNGVYHKKLVFKSNEAKEQSFCGIEVAQSLSESVKFEGVDLPEDETMTIVYETFQKNNIQSIGKFYNKLTLLQIARKWISCTGGATDETTWSRQFSIWTPTTAPQPIIYWRWPKITADLCFI